MDSHKIPNITILNGGYLLWSWFIKIINIHITQKPHPVGYP